MNCAHASVRCINQYELIRKYECSDCDSVMMCQCDVEVGRKFLPHQLRYGTDLETKDRYPVTAGFQPTICAECRGLPAVPAPKAAMRGATSNVRRYYWREIATTTMRRFGTWAETEGLAYDEARRKHREVYEKIHEAVVEEIKRQHEVAPKYRYATVSSADVLRSSGVEVVEFHATFVKSIGRSVVLDGNERVSVDDYVARHYRALGYQAEIMESRPFHALFATFMWIVTEDFADGRTRPVLFGARQGTAVPLFRGMTQAILPDDFGSPGYGRRRRRAIDKQIDEIPDDRREWLWLFDYQLPNSHRLREYLHAHDAESVRRARLLVEVLPVDALRRVLRYLALSYWKRYLGWPDLLVYRDMTDFFFVEVKGSGDHLSDDQKNWIVGNASDLKLPFKLARIHRDRVVVE